MSFSTIRLALQRAENAVLQRAHTTRNVITKRAQELQYQTQTQSRAYWRGAEENGARDLSEGTATFETTAIFPDVGSPAIAYWRTEATSGGLANSPMFSSRFFFREGTVRLTEAKSTAQEAVVMMSTVTKSSPYLVSGLAACCFMIIGDVVAQTYMPENKKQEGAIKDTKETTTLVSGQKKPHSWDYRRTLALAAWGLVWYGGPQQFLWLRLYPTLIGRGTNFQAGLTCFADCFVNQLIVYVPAFYIVTGLVKGETLPEAWETLKKEYINTVAGQAGFWTPLQFFNFRYVPVHCQTFVVGAANIVNKTWLCWISNRDRCR